MKGNGLCHGITGNIYPFLTLAKATKDNKWMIRAFRFATLSFNMKVIEKCVLVSDIKGKSKNKDYTLMQGMAGDIILYTDVITGEG